MIIGICDDDEKIIRSLKQSLTTFYQQAQCEADIYGFVHPNDLLRAVQDHCFDILFIDIMLGEEHGVDLASKIRTCKTSCHCSIIYISSIEDYSKKLISTHPEEYMLKPIQQPKLYDLLDRLMIEKDEKKESFYVTIKQSTFKIYYCDIVYVESIGRKCIIHTKQKNYEAYTKLSELAHNLYSHCFVEIHKSYIINSNQMTSYTYIEVTMEGGIVLPISQCRRKAVRHYIMEFIMNG